MGFILGLPGRVLEGCLGRSWATPARPFCEGRKVIRAGGEFLKIIGVQIVAYGFRTSAGTKSEQIAERWLFFGFGLCRESVQGKLEQRGL